jgi:hypothetical protein
MTSMSDATLGGLGIKRFSGRVRKGSCELSIERFTGRTLVIGAKTLTEAVELLNDLFGQVGTRPVLPIG